MWTRNRETAVDTVRKQRAAHFGRNASFAAAGLLFVRDPRPNGPYWRTGRNAAARDRVRLTGIGMSGGHEQIRVGLKMPRSATFRMPHLSRDTPAPRGCFCERVSLCALRLPALPRRTKKPPNSGISVLPMKRGGSLRRTRRLPPAGLSRWPQSGPGSSASAHQTSCPPPARNKG